MSRFVVDLSDNSSPAANAEPMFGADPPKPRRRWLRVLALIGGVLGVIVLLAGIGGAIYWQSLKGTPQYSLALLVDAAKNDDKKAIDSLVDINAVVDDFVPQITGKAVELYGKGLPPKVVAKLAQIATPVLPAVKDRARAELPRIIRERVERFGNVPFAAMVIGAGQYLDITVNGDTATVKSKIAERPLEIKMRRNGDRWQITGVKDDNLATDIARKIGQEIIAIAVNGGVKKTADTLGVGSLTDLLKKAEELMK